MPCFLVTWFCNYRYRTHAREWILYNKLRSTPISVLNVEERMSMCGLPRAGSICMRGEVVYKITKKAG